MHDPKTTLKWPGGELNLEAPKVMGVLNVTPDSFSDGGQYLQEKKAIDQAWKIAKEGADILDVGAESTRPGAQDVDVKTEQERLWPVLESLSENHYPIPISLDSKKPAVVRWVLEKKWAQIVNDVGGLRKPEMRDVILKFNVPVILMHMFGTPETMQKDFRYRDVVHDILEFFQGRITECGLKENLVLDPGIGFGKSVENNLEIFRRFPEFKALGFPLLIGASRKSFIGKLFDRTADDRLEESLAVAAISVFQGASIVRAHDVAATVRVVRMAKAILGTPKPPFASGDTVAS